MAQDHTYPHILVKFDRIGKGHLDKLTEIAGVRWREWKKNYWFLITQLNYRRDAPTILE